MMGGNWVVSVKAGDPWASNTRILSLVDIVQRPKK